MPELKKIYLVIIVAVLILTSSVSAEKVNVSISGITEKIQSFQKDDINYISLSELVEIIGGSLNWEIIGHQVYYVLDTNRFDF
ncbi:MAG: hypothetical protein ACE5D6_06175, partial [Candidatus Zixiibacteriota bacterium]